MWLRDRLTCARAARSGEKRKLEEFVKRVAIFTDGACSGNPGPGGYGVVMRYEAATKELSRGFRRTTNNRMELLAAIAGLEALKKPCSVELYSDSKYVVNGIAEGWAVRWRSRGWRRERDKLAVNWDLWARLLLLTEQHSASFRWIKGHAG